MKTKLLTLTICIVALLSVNLAYGRYPVSPYAYVLNNPLRYVDPDGRDVWEMDHQGRTRWIEESEKHTMYALNSDGVRTGQSITISDRSIFDNLTSTGSNSGYTASYSGGNPSELASVFLFGADNSNVEWRFSRYNEGNGDQYAVGTAHINDLSPSAAQMGFDYKDEIAFIHSHPGKYSSMTGQYGEHGSMGWRAMSAAEANFSSQPKGTLALAGDSRNVYEGNTSDYPSNAYYMTYIPHSGNIYQVRGAQYPAFIRNIKGHNYNPKRLFWGVLNGR